MQQLPATSSLHLRVHGFPTSLLMIFTLVNCREELNCGTLKVEGLHGKDIWKRMLWSSTVKKAASCGLLSYYTICPHCDLHVYPKVVPIP